MNEIETLKNKAFNEIAKHSSDCFDSIRNSNKTLSGEVKLMIQEAITQMTKLNAQSQKELNERMAGQDIIIADLKGKIWPRWVMWLIVGGTVGFMISSTIPWVVLSNLINKLNLLIHATNIP